MTLARVPPEAATAHSHAGELVSEAEGQQVSFLDLVDLIWQGRRLVLATITLILVLAFVHMRIATPAYTASMIVMPVSSGTEGSSLASSALRSLSPLVGLDLSSSDPQVSAFDIRTSSFASLRLTNTAMP